LEGGATARYNLNSQFEQVDVGNKTLQKGFPKKRRIKGAVVFYGKKGEWRRRG